MTGVKIKRGLEFEERLKMIIKQQIKINYRLS